MCTDGEEGRLLMECTVMISLLLLALLYPLLASLGRIISTGGLTIPI
jgi:hypothetical protein